MRWEGRGYRVVAWPRERRLVTDTLALGHRKPMIHGLLEVMDGRRRSEHAVRFGVGASSGAVWEATDPVPVPNGLEFILDMNADGSLDRLGAAIFAGF